MYISIITNGSNGWFVKLQKRKSEGKKETEREVKNKFMFDLKL